MGKPVKRGGSFTFAQSSATASVVVVSLRSSVISAQPQLPDRFDLLGMAEGVKKGFCRFQVGRLEPFAEPVVDGPVPARLQAISDRTAAFTHATMIGYDDPHRAAYPCATPPAHLPVPPRPLPFPSDFVFPPFL